MKLSFGKAARELGLLYPHIAKLAKAGHIKYEVIGDFKFIDRADLPAIRAAAELAGYIQHGPKPDPKDFGDWLWSIGWENGEAELSGKLRENMFRWFMDGSMPAEPNEAHATSIPA